MEQVCSSYMCYIYHIYVNITGSYVRYSAYYYFGYWHDISDYQYHCTGSESSLDSCPSFSSTYYCNSAYDAVGVRCVTLSMYINLFH